MNLQSNDANKSVESRGEQDARTTDQDFTGERRDAEKNTTDQPGENSHTAMGDAQLPKEAELGHS